MINAGVLETRDGHPGVIREKGQRLSNARLISVYSNPLPPPK